MNEFFYDLEPNAAFRFYRNISIIYKCFYHYIITNEIILNNE